MGTNLKFRCTNCSEYIYLKYLSEGDTAECRNCKQLNVVPRDAEVISSEENLDQQADQSQNTVDPSEEDQQTTQVWGVPLQPISVNLAKIFL